MPKFQVGPEVRCVPALAVDVLDAVGEDCVLFMPFGLDVKDRSVYCNHGTINGSLTFVNGRVGKALKFTGNDADYVTVPHSPVLSGFTQGFSCVFWLLLYDAAKRSCILNKYKTTTGGRSWFVEHDGTYTDALRLFASADGATYKQWNFSNTRLPTNQWFHIAFTWLPNTIPNLYVNGVKQSLTGGTDVISQFWQNTGVQLYIGKCEYQTGRALNGVLDEVCIFNRALTQHEVQRLFRLMRLWS